MAVGYSKLSVAIVGGGISGLVAAVALQQRDHEVTVVEQKRQYLDSNTGGGISLTANALRCLDRLGIDEAFDQIADKAPHRLVYRFDGLELGESLENRRCFLHRADLLRVLHQRAVDVGVRVISGTTFDAIQEEPGCVKLSLHGGETIQADVLIGADGINSKIRQYVPAAANVRPVLNGACTFIVNVPKEKMQKHTASAELYKAGMTPFQLFVGPERSIVSWTMSNRETYHLHFNDHKYGTGEAYGLKGDSKESFTTHFDRMHPFRERWKDHGEAIRQLLQETESCMRWKIAEVADFESWSSPSGRIVLVGDAAHAFPPFAGQGACLSIEDATALSALLSERAAIYGLPAIAKAYDNLRQPRTTFMREVIRQNAETFSAVNGLEQLERDKRLAEKTNDAIPTLKWQAVIEDYDAYGEAMKYEFKS